MAIRAVPWSILLSTWHVAGPSHASGRSMYEVHMVHAGDLGHHVWFGAGGPVIARVRVYCCSLRAGHFPPLELRGLSSTYDETLGIAVRSLGMGVITPPNTGSDAGPWPLGRTEGRGRMCRVALSGQTHVTTRKRARKWCVGPTAAAVSSS